MSKYLAAFPLFFLFLSLNVESANSQLPSFSELAEASSPAVVNISSSKTVSSSNRGFSPRGFEDPFYDDFFKRFFGEHIGKVGLKVIHGFMISIKPMKIKVSQKKQV